MSRPDGYERRRVDREVVGKRPRVAQVDQGARLDIFGRDDVGVSGLPAIANTTTPFETPTDPDSPWQSPGPASETFEVELGDGSVVTYAWYRFVDQPTMRHHTFTDAERATIQARVEMIHREWTPDRTYLARPSVGELVSLDEGVLVTPPPGLEVGYVPIAIRQARLGE